jgi:hypothetical protein
VPTPRKPNPQKRGRKPTWQDGNLELAKKLAMFGLTDVEMADFFGVSSRTFTRWKLSKPEFCLALKEGKEIADARVERRLYERAIGYSIQATKIVVAGGKVHCIPYSSEYPPETAAAIFWLKHRQTEKWRDKIEANQAATRYNFIGMVPTEEEWIKRYGSHPDPVIVNEGNSDVAQAEEE